MNEVLPINQIERDQIKLKNSFWQKLPRVIKMAVLILILICGVFRFIPPLNVSFVSFLEKGRNIINIKDNKGNISINQENHSEKNITRSDACDGEVPFTEEYWKNLKRIRRIGNEDSDIFGLNESGSASEGAMLSYFKKCNGRFEAALNFTPLLNNAANTDIGYGEFFFWEIGGGDLRSIRLFWNQNQPRPNWNTQKLTTHYLNPKNTQEQITHNKPVKAIFTLERLPDSRTKTTLKLKYYSTLQKKEVESNVYEYYFEDFPININDDPEEIKVGLSDPDKKWGTQVRLKNFVVKELP